MFHSRREHIEFGMSHLAYNCVVNGELCLSLLNLDHTMFYPPHSIAALHVDEMPWQTPIDDRWEHTQGTLKKSPVLLSLCNFTPGFMNRDIAEVFNENFNPEYCTVDELEHSQAASYLMSEWWYSSRVPIKPDWDCMRDYSMEFKPSFAYRNQNDKITMHCLKFLRVMADRNTELVNDFIMMVPVYPVAVGKQITDNTSQGASGPGQLRALVSGCSGLRDELRQKSINSNQRKMTHLERETQRQGNAICMVKDLTKLSVFLEELKNRSQPTQIQSLWHMSIAETVETLHNAVLELTPAAVKSGWFQETAMVFAIHELQCDVDNILMQLVFVATHPKEEFIKSGHITKCFTKCEITKFVSDRVAKLRDLQMMVFDTPLWESGLVT